MLHRRTFAALAALFFVLLPGHAWAQKTKAALTTEINTMMPSGGSGTITASILRSALLDIVNSYLDSNGGAATMTAALDAAFSCTSGQTIQRGVSVWGCIGLLASPALTGIPTTPTAAPGTNSTQIASTAYADAIAALKANANRNISTGCGLSGGGDLSADRTLRLSLTINAQTGTTYAIVDGDCGKLVSLSNASPVAVTLPQANGATFISGWSVDFQNKGAGTVTITPTVSTVNGATTLILAQNQGAHCQSDGTNYTCMLGVGAGGGAGTVTSVIAGPGLTGGTITASGTITAPSVMPQGRLTLLTGNPVMSTSQSAKGTLFYDCYVGNAVPYFNGTIDTFDTVSGCEVSDAMVSAASAGQVVSGQVYDVFWVHGGVNRICVAMSTGSGGGGGWAADTGGSNTVRGSGYSAIDRTRGYPTNTNSVTNCFNAATNYGPVSAHQGTFLGTFFATANGQTSFTFGSNATGGGQAASLYLWNAHNRVDVKTSVSDSATSWTITDGLVHSFHDDAGTRLNFVMGLAEDGIGVNVFQEICANATVYQIMAIGFALDRSGNTTFDKVTINYVNSTAVAAVGLWCGSESVNSTYAPQLGAHFVQALENQDGQATAWTGTYFGGIRTSFDGYFRM